MLRRIAVALLVHHQHTAGHIKYKSFRLLCRYVALTGSGRVVAFQIGHGHRYYAGRMHAQTANIIGVQAMHVHRLRVMFFKREYCDESVCREDDLPKKKKCG